MSARAAAYQQQITGAPPGQVYRVNGIAFDGYIDGVLLDAKGLGFKQHLDKNGRFKPYFRGADDFLEDATRQLNAAGNTPIRWVVAEAETATAIRSLFAREGIGIEVVHVPAR